MNDEPRRRGRPPGQIKQETSSMEQAAQIEESRLLSSREEMDEDRARRKVTRETRHALTGSTLRLTAETNPNYQYRWVNDDPGRIAKFENAGYVTVQAKDAHSPDGVGTVASVAAGINPEGKERRSVLMRIPRHGWYNDYLEQKRRIVDETEAPIHEARPGKATRPVSGPEANPSMETGEFYTPTSGTSLRRQSGGL